MEDDVNTLASLVLLSRQYFVLPICIPPVPNTSTIEELKTKSHVMEKNPMTHLLLLKRAQTRMVQSRVVKGIVNGENMLSWRIKSQLAIGAADKIFRPIAVRTGKQTQGNNKP